MQKISHNIQYPRFPKLIELWEEHRRVEDRKEINSMEKEKTELKEVTAYTCVILALEFAANKSFDICKRGDLLFLLQTSFKTKHFALGQKNVKNPSALIGT